MIKANELRIGNVVTRKGKWVVLNDDELEVLMGARDYENIEPIPLTPEILEKCGLLTGWNGLGNEQAIEIDIDEGMIYLCPMEGVVRGHDFRVPCKFLHQLQNLYFALTGEELEISL